MLGGHKLEVEGREQIVVDKVPDNLQIVPRERCNRNFGELVVAAGRNVVEAHTPDIHNYIEEAAVAVESDTPSYRNAAVGAVGDNRIEGVVEEGRDTAACYCSCSNYYNIRRQVSLRF